MDINEREPNDRLRALLRDAGWTQEGLARAVNALGGEIGDDLRYDRSAVAHWLTGTEPRGPVPQLVAEALTRRMGRTVTPQEAGFRSDPATDRTETPGTDPLEGIAALHRAATGTSGSPPSQRRPYRAADAQVPPRPVPRLLVPPGRRKDPEERTFPSPRVAALDDAVRFFATAIDAHGGLHARTALAAYLADDVAPLLRAPMASGERSQILVASSRLCMLLGRMYADGLQQGVAQHYFTYAHQLAGEAGDQDAWATVLRMMSAQARRLGHTADALRLAEAAAEAVTSAAPARRA